MASIDPTSFDLSVTNLNRTAEIAHCSFALYREFVETRPPEVIANIAICLIHQTNYLIDQQLRRLEKGFLEQGGLRERMFKARINRRNGRLGNLGKQGRAQSHNSHVAS